MLGASARYRLSIGGGFRDWALHVLFNELVPRHVTIIGQTVTYALPVVTDGDGD